MILSKRRARIAALTFALTFLVTAGVDALGLHECPHHDPWAAELAHDADAATHAHEGADAGHATGVAAGGDAHDGSHGDHAGCTCVGSCQLGGAAAGVVPSASIDRLPATPVRRAEVPHEALLLAPHPPFFLPFANAPPGLA